MAGKSEIKQRMRDKLTQAVKDEIKKDKVKKTIDSVQIDDGIIVARFTVQMPKVEEKSKEESSNKIGSETTWETFTKNFKTKEEFNAFVWNEFFNDFETE